MRNIEIAAEEFLRQPETYLNAALAEDVVCVEKEGRHVCILSDTHWKMIVEALEAMLSARLPIK